MTEFQLRTATGADLEPLLELVRAYHEFENIDLADERRRSAVGRLLDSPELGRVSLIDKPAERAPVGYIALCFGYSIEFAGRDAFIDEFFIAEAHRGQGLGRAVLEQVLNEAGGSSVHAVHLEVGRENSKAQRLYGALGFETRDGFALMSCKLRA